MTDYPEGVLMITITYIHRCRCTHRGQVTERRYIMQPDGTYTPERVLCAETNNELEIVSKVQT